MKPIKMLGLAVLAGLFAMAFIGASSAMASETVLCANDSLTSCTPVTHAHEATLAGSANQAVLKTSILTVKCDVLFLSTSVLGGGPPEVIHGNFTYSNCNNSCVITEENGPAEIQILRTSHETATVTGEGLAHVECGTFIDCLYNYTGLVGTAKGALLSSESNGEVKFTEQSLAEEGGSFFCPDTSKLTIVTTPLSATYIKLAECLNIGAMGSWREQGTPTSRCASFLGLGNGTWEQYYL